MSLPVTKPAQTSIRSFFSAKGPKYAPPPSQAVPVELSSPPPPPTAAAPPPTTSSSDFMTPSTSSGAIPPLPASLPQEATIRLVSGDDVNALRRINALLLPVSYPDNFYQRAVEPSASGRFSRVITWSHDGAESKVVGGVVCRVEPILDPNSQGAVPQNLYIQSLCLLSPYRSLGLVNAAVDNIIATAVSDPNLNVTNVTAHVWTENEEGLKWYEGRGFKRENQPIQGYYLKLRPNSAWLVSRPTGASVRNLVPSSSSASQHSLPEGVTTAIANLSAASGPPGNGNPRPNMPPSGKSYQNQRPDTEWNDLPEDMASSRLAPPRGAAGGTGSTASSRSSSAAARKKRDRSYPAAAFGS
ncbi:pre-mRNA-splicing factor cwc24 [Fusarium heterosporum]|uniref:Pre-mRNA-splicing factor cwc24 n=1 Tax=Fusarium heterosporum TaxID=42747 RepID=A0A8H5X420_FUSHE|nr:pre-mRNA-splicing factor cwc24 [Fusarium heterosporum]